MRPDIEDYEELNVAADSPRARGMSWLVLITAVGGFAALAYYAYHAGTQPTQNGEMLVVQADEAPIKQAPENPEGEQFANKDKTIYDVIAPNAASGEQGEKLLPDPEQPVAVRETTPVEAAEPAPAPEASGRSEGATTYVSKNLKAAETSVDRGDAKATEQAPKQTVTVESSKPVAAVKTEANAEPVAKAASAAAPVAKGKQATAAPVMATSSAPLASAASQASGSAVAATAEAPTQPVEKSTVTASTETIGAPTMVNESSVVGGKKEEPAKVAAKESKAATKPAKEAPKPAKEKAKPAPAASVGGAYQVQLGAFRSPEEAQTAWKKISAKFGGVIGGSSSVVKVELDSGTFYRLRAGGFASSAAAKSACAKLSAQKQACFPVAQ